MTAHKSTVPKLLAALGKRGSSAYCPRGSSKGSEHATDSQGTPQEAETGTGPQKSSLHREAGSGKENKDLGFFHANQEFHQVLQEYSPSAPRTNIVFFQSY